MILKFRLLTVLSILAIFLSGCGRSSLNSAYNVTRCEYKYTSISNLTLSGMNLSKGVSPLQMPRVLTALSGASSSIPLDFIINLNVKNPNTTDAVLNGLEYSINIDDIQFTRGKVNNRMSISPGGNQNLPLNIGVDLATLMKSESKTAVQNMTKNFIGIGNEKSKVTLQIKPTFIVRGVPITSPVYIPVSFTFGGK